MGGCIKLATVMGIVNQLKETVMVWENHRTIAGGFSSKLFSITRGYPSFYRIYCRL